MGRTDEKHPEDSTFVARLWVERGPHNRPVWRGKVKHVQGEREAYFENLEELRSFLREVSGVPAFGEWER